MIKNSVLGDNLFVILSRPDWMNKCNAMLHEYILICTANKGSSTFKDKLDVKVRCIKEIREGMHMGLFDSKLLFEHAIAALVDDPMMKPDRFETPKLKLGAHLKETLAQLIA